MDVAQDQKSVGRRRLSAADWAQAALEAIGEGGLAAVAVEPLAVRLGATKGSFYWHFPGREALIEAALVRWEQVATAWIIDLLEAQPDPVIRLRSLLARVGELAQHNVREVNLLAAADHELVGPVVRRVTERRIAYTVGLFEQIGFPPAEAGRRGALAFAAFIGHSELTARLPGVLGAGAVGDPSGYLDSILDVLLRDAPKPPVAGG